MICVIFESLMEDSMYISKVLIDVKIPAVRHDLNSPDLFYNTIKTMTGDSKPVYRIENIPLNQADFIQPVLVVSESRPDIYKSGKPSGYFKGVETLEYALPVREGMVYKFFIKANPSVKIFFKVYDVDTDEARIKWLETESSPNGFDIIDCKCSDDGYIISREKNRKLSSAIYEGALKIHDTNKFVSALYKGIGRGRSLGLGLLSVESFSSKNRNIAEEMKNSQHQ
jgi:hypothetical protein